MEGPTSSFNPRRTEATESVAGTGLLRSKLSFHRGTNGPDGSVGSRQAELNKENREGPLLGGVYQMSVMSSQILLSICIGV